MRLAADEVLGAGRYVLLAPCGADERAGLEFWHAKDIEHDRDVALTAMLGDERDAQHVRDSTRYAEPARHSALAPVLDVPTPDRHPAGDDGMVGLVVAEWSDGVDLADGVLDGQLPISTVCRLLRPLVEAVDTVHHFGVVAGVDAPGRIRISEHGPAIVAFRGTSPMTTSRDDIRGLGAVLYLSLTGSWPVADKTGRLIPPVVLRRDVPRDLSLVAVLSLDSSQGPDIRTCGPLLKALDETIAFGPTELTAPMPRLKRMSGVTMYQPVEGAFNAEPVPEPQRPREPRRLGAALRTRRAGTSPELTPVALTEAEPATEAIPAQRPTPDPVPVAAPRPEPEPRSAPPRRQRRWPSALRGRRVAIAAGTIVAAVAVLIGTLVAGSFGAANTAAPPVISHAPVPPTTTTTTPPPTTTTTTPPPPPPPIAPASVQEYVVSGSEDNPSALHRVMDGDPGSGWKTDTYRQQFPAFQPGIGFLAAFTRPTAFSSVTITSPSAGTVVEIHAAPTPETSLAGAPLLATATLQSGATVIPLTAHPATPYLLVWITRLDFTGGGYMSQIDEITCQPTG